jgi:REP element-mobilizing transposase RayT
MTRPLRVLYPGAVYHITVRGNERRRVFRDTADYEEFLKQLALAIGRYGWLCHGYCLMGNHYHLLLETPRANLPIGMRHLNGCYSQRFNKRWKRVGHLFQGRYSAEVVEKQAYLLELVRYVALNPMRAVPPLCQAPEEYRWSSYRILLGLAPRPEWLTVDWVLAQFGDDYATARARLKAFVEEGLEERPQPVGGLYHADDSFIRERTAAIEPIPEVPRAHWQPLRPPLSEIFETAAEPIATAYRTYGYTLRAIAEHLGCHYSTVSRRLRRSEVRECKT